MWSREKVAEREAVTSEPRSVGRVLVLVVGKLGLGSEFRAMTGGTYSKCGHFFIFICKRLTLLENRVATNFGEDRSSNTKCADI